MPPWRHGTGLERVANRHPVVGNVWRNDNMNKLLSAVAAVSMLMSTHAAFALDKVTLGTNWLAQAAHGGFYQALVDGTYERYGLDVTIEMGGPQVNNRPMLAAGRIDFLMSANLLLVFNNVASDIPTVAVASFFQSDPQALMAHEGEYKDFRDLANAPELYLSRQAQFTYFAWMQKEFGFKEEQLRPYTFNIGQFLNNKQSVQQAYATAEPRYAAKQGAKVTTYLLADYGWNTYANIIETRQQLVADNPDLVQRFVDASIEGWYNFLYGDRTKAYERIINDNPEMTAESLDEELALALELKLIENEDTLKNGIGAMQLDRVREFYDLALNAGILEKEFDVNEAVTDAFVNKGFGLDIRKKLNP